MTSALFSRVCLGGAQFGMSYGVSNTRGVVGDADLDNILDLAKSVGITAIDTAQVYGSSESRLGVARCGGFNFVTKMAPLSGCSRPVNEDTIVKQVATSFSNLNVDQLYGVLLHDPEELAQPYSRLLVEILRDFQLRGKIKKVGLSGREVNQTKELVSQFELDLVQLPFNALDRRLERSGGFDFFESLGVEIHVRSVFLQGLLLMKPHERPRFFNRWSDELGFLDSQLNELTPVEKIAALLKPAFDEQRISKLVIGISSFDELRDLVESVSLVPECQLNLPNTLTNAQDLLDPFRWELN